MSFISIIIPTRNRCELLATAVRSSLGLAEADGNAEVIVVDNGSTDGTRVLCEGLQRESAVFRYVYDARPGLHVGRHVGMRTAKGDILLYADDDIEPFSTWLPSIREAFADATVGLVGGKCLPKYEILPPSWERLLWHVIPGGRCNGNYSLIDFGESCREIKPWYVFGCNFAIRRQVLKETGGFHPDGMPRELLRYRGDGETAVSKAIDERGYKTVYHPGASVYHWVSRDRLTFRYVYTRAFANGVSDSYVHIRKLGTATPATDTPNRLFNQAKSYYRKWRKLLGLLRHGTIDEFRLQRVQQLGYRAGWDFHQREVQQDRDLLEWVLLPDYWDAAPNTFNL